MGKLTVEERQFLTEHLSRTREQLLATVADLREDQWKFRPNSETWSIAEGADHIVAVERRLLQLVSTKMQKDPPDLERAAAVQGKEKFLLKAVPARQVRVKVPPGVEPDGHNGSPAEFAAHFKEMRTKTLAYVRESQDPVHDRVSPHFVLQDLDGCQWLLMISLHTERHSAQIEEVKAHPEYPK